MGRKRKNIFVNIKKNRGNFEDCTSPDYDGWLAPK